jgi:hypothetical protein
MVLNPLRAAILAATLCAAATPTGAAAESDLLLTYDVRFSGVTIMQAEARLNLAEGVDERYEVGLKGRTVGLIDRLKPIAFTAASEGAASPAGLQPVLYSTSTAKRDKRKGLTVAFAPETVPVTQFTPPDDAEEPVPPELLEGTLDPASAMLALVRSVARTGSCAGSQAIFDGKRRYDVTFADLPKQRLEHEAYAGEASLCRAQSRPVFGFKPGKRAPLDGTILWFGQVLEGAPPLPIQVETEISVGAVWMELTSARWVDRQASR